VEYGKLNEESILELNVNPSDEFRDIKVKIQGNYLYIITDNLQDDQ